MSAAEILDRYAWWASLNHGGLLVAPSKLAERFPTDLPALPGAVEGRLRRDLVRLREGGEEVLTAFLDTVLEEVLELHAARWIKGSQLDKSWTRTAVTREAIRPRRVWLGPRGAVLPVFVPERADGSFRPGVGRGRRDVSRVVEWLRKANHKVALLAGGRHLRLIHAGTDYDAFCEWDTDLWFQEGAPGPQVTALRALLGRDALSPEAEGQPSRLLAAIQATRQGQAELSTALGERVRQAVETLIRESAPALAAIDRPGPGQVGRRDIYIAATRLVMRCVVILFAEARQEDLLPRNNPIYEQSYGLNGLRLLLARMAGGRAADTLRHSHAAWPRLLALFSLLYHGSPHGELPVPRYGGGLFTPGDASAPDPVLRALGAFEGPENAPSDAAVHRILELLCNSPVKVRQGRASRWIEAPVDFSDLSSEYLGILYEGLLDFELRRAPDDDAMVFLNLGEEPVLPISRLDRMTSDELVQLLDRLAKGAKKSEPDEDEEAAEEADDEAAEEPEADAEPGAPDEGEPGDEVEPADGAHAIREKIQLWAERAVKAAKLVKYPRNDKDPRVREQYARDVSARARALIRREVMPGSWFLVRWGGTRKGSGTFYTRPQLAGPTVRRALEPLAYVPVSEVKDEATGVVTVTEWAPKRPEEILALKVCDPAMGSGSFLLSALRYLTEALHESLHFHGRLEERADGVIPRLADGAGAEAAKDETLPVPKDHPDFEKRLRARLKRYVVERCLYGVDLDPLAVELAKTALWVETMDPKLPFGFLDHKLKCGNSLVGCWFDRFQDYPVMAWEREGGDKGHDRFVHHFREYVGTKGKEKGKTIRAGDKWTAAIKERRDKVIKPELARWLEARFSGQGQLDLAIDGKSAEALHDEALGIFEKMHRLPVSEAEERERVYRQEIAGSKAIRRLREAFDTWCALWFWPGDELDKAPGPMSLLDPGAEALEVVGRVREKERFFHWEIEFPDVFARPGSGFDAMVGNPPWEIQKPNSMEFFSNHDPLYRTYKKQEALQRQAEIFAQHSQVEHLWLSYAARLKGLSNWTKKAADAPDVGSQRVVWPGYADRVHPFRFQGAGVDTNTYKMFLELAHALLAPDGALGLLVPSGLYSDNASGPLRELFLHSCRWTHLYAFQNERFVFEGIHHSFKVAVVHVRKMRDPAAMLVRFRLGPGDSPEAHEIETDLGAEAAYVSLLPTQIAQFSPTSGSLLEFRTTRDLAAMNKIYRNSLRMGDTSGESWEVSHRQELHMTHDSSLFVGRNRLEEQGYRADAYGHWIKGSWQRVGAAQAEWSSENEGLLSQDGSHFVRLGEIEDLALPLHQGIMVRSFELGAKGWVSGTAARAVWQDSAGRVLPQYLVPNARKVISERGGFGWKLAHRRIARSTDTRTWISSPLFGAPTGDSMYVLLTPEQSGARVAALAGMSNSFVFDWMLRNRLGGTNISWFVLEDTVLARAEAHGVTEATSLAIRLSGTSVGMAHLWKAFVGPRERPWRRLWAVTPHERLRLRALLDAVVAHLYGLDLDDFAWILRDCDHPVARVTNKPFSRTLDPKGFWRVDKDKDPELRHPVLALVAFHHLQQFGLDAFLAQNDGEGWMLPETLRLADYGLGHDDRAREAQPVAARLGERFLPWQLEQGVEASWEECRRHAETIEQILGGKKPAEATEAKAAVPAVETAPAPAPKPKPSTDVDGDRKAKPAAQLTLDFTSAPRVPTIGGELRAALERERLSQAGFAARVGVEVGVVEALASSAVPFDAGAREAMVTAVRGQNGGLRIAKVTRAIDALIALVLKDGPGEVQVMREAARRRL